MRNCVVLGSGRSGTSMVTGSLAKAGYFMGDRLYPGRDANPRGFFEDPEINGINEELLAAHVPAAQRLAAPQRWLATLERSIEGPLPPPLFARVAALVARSPFCFKDPRFSYTLPAWRPALGDARFVCVFRDPATTAASIVKECATADYLRGVAMDPTRALLHWSALYRQIVRRHRHDGSWLFLHYDQVLGGDGLARLAEFLDAPVDRAFPTAELRRSRPEAPLPAEVAQLYGELCGLSGFEPEAATRTQFAVAMASPMPPAAPSTVPSTVPEISVLLCTYQRKAILAECLKSFDQQTLAPERYEIVVVVDGATDGSAELVRNFQSRATIRLVERPRNLGLSAARSAAVAAARGDRILLANDDTIAFPDLLERHLAAHARHAGRAVAVLGTFEQPQEQLATALMRMLERTDLVFCYPKLKPGEFMDWMRFWGCNISVSRRETIEAGAFDAAFRHYGCEDSDLGLRLGRRGIPVVYEPTARAWHRHVLRFDDLERRQQTVARAFVRFFAKHPTALHHPTWDGLRRMTADQLAALAEPRGAEPPTAELTRVARELAAIDCAALEAANPAAARVAERTVTRLIELLNVLNRRWWNGGFAAALRDFGVASFRELALLRTHAVEPWPLPGDAPVKLLAWPKWDDPHELAELVAVATDSRLAAAAPQLVLRHDPASDGPFETARERLEAACRGAPAGRAITASVLPATLTERDWPRLGLAVTAALLLDSSDEPARARFFLRAGAAGVRAADELLAQLPVPPLAAAPATQPVTTAATTWNELSV